MLQLLEIALAIAVTMLVFATLATLVVEALHTLLKLRASGLRGMLGALYEAELAALGDAGAHHPSSAGHEAFIATMILAGRPPSARMSAGGAGALRRAGAALGRGAQSSWRTTRLPPDDNITLQEFLRRLADTEPGRALARRARGEIDAVVDDLAARFEDYGRRASAHFRRRARLLTLAVSVLMALALNVNVYSIFLRYAEDPALTQRISAQADSVMQRYEALVAAGSDDGASTTPAELRADLEALRTTLASAEDLGIPFGWNMRGGELLPPCLWFTTTILTGLLIGLGGPFWFDVVKRLQPIARVAGAVGAPVRRPRTPEDAERETTSVARSEAREAFHGAVAARTVRAGASTNRHRLVPAGTRL